MSAETVKVQIIQKAWEDPAFKNQLLEDPKGAIKMAFGIELPADIELKVVEETTTSYVLVIPPNPEDVSLPDGSAPNYVWV